MLTFLTKVEILFNLRRQMDSLQRKQAMDFKWYLIIVQEYFLTIDESFSYDSKKIMAKVGFFAILNTPLTFCLFFA